MRRLRNLQRDYSDSPYLFVSQKGGPISKRTVYDIIVRAGQFAGIDFPSIPTCFATVRATSSLQKPSIRGLYRAIWGTQTSSTLFYTPSSIRRVNQKINQLKVQSWVSYNHSDERPQNDAADDALAKGVFGLSTCAERALK